MDHPYGKQYGQEGNPRAYMTMRDYRNLPYQWGNQQPVGRNPNPPRSMREYRDQWMSGPVYSVPSTYPPPPQYDHPEPPFYAPIPQSPQSPQPPQLISPLEQVILNLTKQVDNFVEESSLDKELDGFQNDFDQKLGILREAISKLTNQLVHQEEENLEEESQEEECLTETVLVEQVQLQPQEELKVESLETPEEMQEAPVNFWPWTKEKEITALLTEKSSGHEGTQEPIIQPNPQAIPIDLDTIATAQDTKTPLPVAPLDDQEYILPTPETKSKPAAPAPKDKSNPLPAALPDSVFILPTPAAQPKSQASTTKATPSMLVLQNIRRLVASVHTFSTTSKKMANAYIAWHSGWFWCGFGFGAPGPRHF